MSITLSALQKQRRDSAANWTAENPTLLAGELGLESDTGYWKVGDGSTAWTSLAYVSGLGGEIPVSRLADGAAGQIIQTDAAGTDVEWSSTTNLPLGTAAAPAYRFQGDPDSGLFSPGANQVAVATNGTGRLFVDSLGRVTVTSSASPGLTVNSAIQLTGTGTSEITTSDASGLYLTCNSNVFFLQGNSDFIFRGAAATSYAERLRITSAGLVGIGTSSPSNQLEIASSVGGIIRLTDTDGGYSLLEGGAGDIALQADPGNTQASSKIQFYVDNSEKARLDSSGRLGIGTTAVDAPLHVVAANGAPLIKGTASTGTNGCYMQLENTAGGFIVGRDNSSGGILGGGAYASHLYSQGAYPLVFSTNSTQRAQIDSSGRLLVGTSTARDNFYNGSTGSGTAPHVQLEGTTYQTSSSSLTCNSTNTAQRSILSLNKSAGSSVGSNTLVSNGEYLGEILFQGNDGTKFIESARIRAVVDGTTGANDLPTRLEFFTTADGSASPTEALRISQDRAVSIGGVSGGMVSSGGYLYVQRQSDTAAFFNRNTNDGTIIDLRQDNVSEGSISVSGTTVSYNGAHLSRWSQLPGGDERTEILRGSVLSNIDEMCEWGDEDNEQLNRMQVSNVEGDKNVSGVFQAWDDDDDTYTNDFYCAMTGDFIIRIGAGTTVERGDLLMSAGDGTAKPQDDDIIRSKTIAKVTSTNVSCTYDDGSYCVPCVLMAC